MTFETLCVTLIALVFGVAVLSLLCQIGFSQTVELEPPDSAFLTS